MRWKDKFLNSTCFTNFFYGNGSFFTFDVVIIAYTSSVTNVVSTIRPQTSLDNMVSIDCITITEYTLVIVTFKYLFAKLVTS